MSPHDSVDVVHPGRATWVVQDGRRVPGVMRMPGGLLDGEVGVVAEGGAHEAIMLGQVSEVGQRQVTAVYRGQFVSVDLVERDPRGASRARLLFPVSDGDDDVLSRTGGSLLARGEGQVLDADVGEGRTGLFHAVRGGGDLAVEDVDRLVVRRAVTRLDGSDVEVVSAGRTKALVVLPLRLWRARAGRRLTDAGRCAWVDVSDLGELVMFSRTSFDGTRAPVAVGDYCSWQGLPLRTDGGRVVVEPDGRSSAVVDFSALTAVSVVSRP